jgi:hypothetical protein
MRRAAILVAVALVGGCGGSAEQDRSDAHVIRTWVDLVSASRYVEAASFFAPGAIVDQGEPIRLRDREAAERFNRGLPCRADLIDTEDEGKTTLASFRLRRGPGGPCNGIVRVRFTIRDQKFVRFIQLPGGGAPPGVEA